MRISVFVGSIVDSRVAAHAIVNASNPEVGLGSGVSGAIREACGGTPYQRLVRDALEEQYGEPLETDDCLVTTGGSATQFRWVLHVPAVDYRTRDRQTGGATGPDRITRCTRAALHAAQELAVEQSISDFVLALPLLGAGHGGLGEVVSADVMLRSIREHDQDALNVAVVRFVVLSEPTARLVHAAAAKHGLPSFP